MPLTYSIDTSANLVRLKGSGTVTDEEVVACITALRDDPELLPEMDTISDMRGIEVAFTSVGIMAMKEVLDRTEDRLGGGRVATITDSDVAYGMGRVTEAQLEQTALKYRVFRDEREALDWLGIDL